MHSAVVCSPHWLSKETSAGQCKSKENVEAGCHSFSCWGHVVFNIFKGGWRPSCCSFSLSCRSSFIRAGWMSNIRRYCSRLSRPSCCTFWSSCCHSWPPKRRLAFFATASTIAFPTTWKKNCCSPIERPCSNVWERTFVSWCPGERLVHSLWSKSWLARPISSRGCSIVWTSWCAAIT